MSAEASTSQQVVAPQGMAPEKYQAINSYRDVSRAGHSLFAETDITAESQGAQ